MYTDRIEELENYLSQRFTNKSNWTRSRRPRGRVLEMRKKNNPGYEFLKLPKIHPNRMITLLGGERGICSPKEIVRMNTVDVLNRYAKEFPRAVSILVDALKDESHAVRAIAARSLSGVDNDDAVLGLIQSLADDPSEGDSTSLMINVLMFS